MIKLKDRFFILVIIGEIFMLSYHLAHAQQSPPLPKNSNQKYVYMHGDTVFEIHADGVEVPLLPYTPGASFQAYYSCAAYHPQGPACFTPIDNFTLEVIPQNEGSRFDADSIIIRDKTKVQELGWVTDSIKWVADDTLYVGDKDCVHDWLYGEPEITGFERSISCLVYHPQGQHCDWGDGLREKICRNCMRSEIERERWFQHFVAPPKSEFEILKEKQRAKQ